MEEYPEELRTPPVSLVGLVGCSEHHAMISAHLNSEQPPINTLALPHFSDLFSLLSSSSSPPSGNNTNNSNNNNNINHPLQQQEEAGSGGILKRDWLVKHRTRVPSLVAALFSSLHLSPQSQSQSQSPSPWLQLCSDLDHLKSLIRPKNIKLAVIVVRSSQDEISEDCMVALRKRAELDSRYVVIFNPNDASQLQQSLTRLGSMFAELAATYYRDEGRRIKARVEKKSFNSPELNVRYCFKVAVDAEFRRDWVEALRFYEDAYHILREMIGMPSKLPAIQRLVQIKTVAEQLHFKIATLLLHGGKLTEAVTWFSQHLASYRKLVGAPEVIFLHWEWMSRQFLVFAELLETSSKTHHGSPNQASVTLERPFTELEFQPAYYYQLAAHYLKEKRTSLELAVSMSESTDEIDGRDESVVPSVFLGQFARLLEQDGTYAMQPLTDEEFTRYAVAEGKRFQDSFEIIALLKKSYESFNILKAQRMASLCKFQIAREYFVVGEFSNARELLDGVANLYRQEGWVTLLWEVLGYLRECSRKCGKLKEFTEYSLEMAALPVSNDTGLQPFVSGECGPTSPPSLVEREKIHKEVFGVVRGEMVLASDEIQSDVRVTGDNPLHLEIDLVSPLRLVLLASVAFHEQIIKPGVPALMTLSLLSHLPLTVQIDQLELQFNQSECNFTIISSKEPPTSNVLHGHRVESASSLALIANKWLRLTYAVNSVQSGKLECIYVVAKVGPHLTVCCRAESPASMDDLPLWKFEDRVESLPTKDPALAFSGQKAVQVEEPDPLVDVILGTTGPALVGERFIVPVTVVSKSHAVFSGELKINLVDVRGGGLFSPRETEPSSLDTHHVELLDVTSSEGAEDESHPDKIKKIQQSFGLVSVPALKGGESWSCKLEIKWHRPKPAVVFVSLGYFPDSSESALQKVHVHKSLQIEGKTALVISHQFKLPFRHDPLLLSRINQAPGSDELASLPSNQKSVLVVSAKNCSEIPIQLQSISVEANDDCIERSHTLQDGGKSLLGPAYIVPGEEFKKVFTIIPEVDSSKILKLGTVSVEWRRNSSGEDWILTKHKLPDVSMELSPLVISLDCPPYACLGDPFTYMVKIRNQTQLLQEVKFSLADAQGFVLSGSHSDTIFVLPKSEHLLAYKVVPLASGLQLLPRVTVTALRYSAAFQASIGASTVFVFPSQPNFKTVGVGDNGAEPVLTG